MPETPVLVTESSNLEVPPTRTPESLREKPSASAQRKPWQSIQTPQSFGLFLGFRLQGLFYFVTLLPSVRLEFGGGW